MGLRDRTRRTTPPWLLAVSLGLACAAVACTNVSGSQGGGYLGGSGGGPLGSPGAGSSDNAGGDAASGAPQSPGSSGGGAFADDASSGAPEASTPTPIGDAGGATDAGAEGGGGGSVDGGTANPFTFTLLDTAVTTNVDGTPVPGYDPLADGTTFSLATVGTALSVRANTVPANVGSVQFSLDNAGYTHTENAVPYTLCGDDGAGTVTACPELTVGTHTLTATEYTQANLGGTSEGASTITFTITQ